MLQSDVLIENVLEIAARRPDRRFATLRFQDGRQVPISYRTLIDRSGRVAAAYRQQGVGAGDVVVIILDELEPLIYAVVGALLYGAIPSIFAQPSTKIRADEYRSTLRRLLQICDTRFLMTSRSLLAALDDPSAGGAIRTLVVEEVLASGDRTDAPAGPRRADDVILLQHSSGTTGLKKGVALSNRSVVQQLRHYAAAIDLTDDDRIASWLPLYHDMGLIACFMLPVATGVPVALMSPFEWIANPRLLLQAIHEERSTLCWLPNFAYNFLASRVEPAGSADLDLSSVRAFINCAEPISANSHDLFYDRFRANGVRREVLCTCYAMAENTFAVTQGGIHSPVRIDRVDADGLRSRQVAEPVPADRPGQLVVSSGEPIANNRVRIVDATGADLPERAIGEIVIHSDSMLTEYYHRPDLTSEAIRNGWYFSGDLGYLAEGSLFVLGRKKDMIIVAGKNIYPQDIEEVVSEVEGVYPGRVVAFGVYSEALGTEEVVVLAESRTDDKAQQRDTRLRIAKAVRDRLECVASEIILLPHMWLAKSSAGKISRPANRARYLSELRS